MLALARMAEAREGSAGGQAQLRPCPGEGTLNTLVLQEPRAGSVASTSSAGRPSAAVPAAGLGAKACSRTAGKTQNNAFQESALGELISSHTWLWVAQNSPQDTAGEETVTIWQHLTPALHGCAIAVTATSPSRTAAKGGQTSKPPLLSRCKGTDSLFMKLSTTSMGMGDALLPAQLRRGSFGVWLGWRSMEEKYSTCNHPCASSKGSLRCVQHIKMVGKMPNQFQSPLK